MKIVRTVNGQTMEFELTDQELRSAFREKQHLIDMDDVRNNWNLDYYIEENDLENYLKASEMDLAHSEQFLDYAATIYREEQDAGAGEWYEDLQESIAYAVKQWLEVKCK